MIDLESINKSLVDLYGYLYNKPRYRLVYAGEQFERRLTEYEGRILGELVATKKEVETVYKYGYLTKDTLVLEKIFPNENPDLLEGQTTYECLWAFHDGNFVALPFNQKALDLVISIDMNPNDPKTLAQMLYERDAADEKELRDTYDMICGMTSMVSAHLSAGTGVFVPGKKDV